MLRFLGWIAWLAHGLLASILLSAASGLVGREGMGELMLGAVTAALVPTFVMVAHLKRNTDLCGEDQLLWRALLLWVGPIAGAVYLTAADRRLSESPIAWILRSFLD